MSENWKRKLTSRKFWMTIAGFITGIIAYIKNPGDPTGLIMSFGSVVAYIVGEGLIDAAGAGAPTITLPMPNFPKTEEEKPPEEPQE